MSQTITLVRHDPGVRQAREVSHAIARAIRNGAATVAMPSMAVLSSWLRLPIATNNTTEMMSTHAVKTA